MTEELTEGAVRAQLGWAYGGKRSDGICAEVPLDYFAKLSKEWFDLTKQCDALRTALEEIAEPSVGNDHQNHCHAKRKIARQALAGQPETHHEDASA